jgi:hypothetical protein
MATLIIMRKQWKYLHAALMLLLLLTISTVAEIGAVSAGDNGRQYPGHRGEIPYEYIFRPPGGTGDGYTLPEPIFLPTCPDEITSIPRTPIPPCVSPLPGPDPA